MAISTFRPRRRWWPQLNGFMGLSLTRNLRDAERRLEETTAGVQRFKVAIIHMDPEGVQARLRGEVHGNIWVESDDTKFVVYADRPFEDAEKRALLDKLPKADVY